VSALLRILGYAWLVVAATAIVVGHLVIWALDGMEAAVAMVGGRGMRGLLTVAALLVPGLVLVALSAWLDWRQGRWSPK